MDQKQVVASLLAKANKYRDFARWIGKPSKAFWP
jgi:hypothetical protein